MDIDPNNGDVYFTDSNLAFIYRVTEEQIKTGMGTPDTIMLDDPTYNNDVDYTKSTRTNNLVEANGIRFTPGGEFIIFDSLNNGELYRMAPPPGNPAAREIVTIGGVIPKRRSVTPTGWSSWTATPSTRRTTP